MNTTIPDFEPLYQVKLLAALRSGDLAAIQQLLAEISRDRRHSGDSKREDEIDTGAAALHLALRCASAETISLLLGHRAISPNGIHPPGSGTTPLHVAASLGRVDVVNLLLEQENVDDTLRDASGKTCRDVARGKDVHRAIDNSRSFLTASYRSLLRSYILSPPSDPPSSELLALLSSPRIKHVDLSYLDEDSGSSLLHEAARRKDLRLIELAVRAGADVFVRDRRGKMASEGASGKDEKVKVFLRQFANQDKTLLPSPVSLSEPPPLLKGYLNKYTNLAKGYNTRWFVLRDGVLSYYRHQDDETIASRGSISMKTAVLRYSERMRFEVHSIPLRGGQPRQRSHQQNQTLKWYMRANHPVEARRWVEAISRSIEYFKQREGAGAESDGGSSRRRSIDSAESVVKLGLGIGTSPSTSSGLLSNGGQKLFLKKLGGNGKERDRDETVSIVASTSGASSHAHTPSEGSPALMGVSVNVAGAVPKDIGIGDGQSDDETEEYEDEAEMTDDAELPGEGGKPPHPDVELHANALSAQLEITTKLAANPVVFATAQTSQSKMKTYQALTESLHASQSLLSTFLHMTREREDWFSRQLKEDRKRQRVWEESLALVVREGEGLQNELKKRRGRGSTFLRSGQLNGDTLGEKGNEGNRRLSAVGMMNRGTNKGLSAIQRLPEQMEEIPTNPAFTKTPTPTMRLTRSGTAATLIPPSSSASSVTLSNTATTRASKVFGNDNEPDTDEEDEFFDAIETGNLPNLVVHECLTSPTTATAVVMTPRASMADIRPPSYVDVNKIFGPADLRSLSIHGSQLAFSSMSKVVDVEPYAGYISLRNRLPINKDDRPSMSLWSVLKHNIGKDLTKISFPVSFNEPTSMLQRMAEDMEFSECLDVAAQEKDPLLRIAFVAAFAMSNYSSTIGRIAKPFNPMLSETFEYVRMDKQYRYISEQVSHHPPISACWCESPLWNYFGEVDAQNKFMGKSFEIRPTGVAHVELLLPKEHWSNYPQARSEALKGKVVEHYSWKKVTTNISGFILGSPTIDHYGDMIVTNHRTGDQCILTFKPRGWRGKDAYEISGQVIDNEGNVAYEVAGRWNSQLVARQVGTGNGQLHPDVSVSASSSREYILLWRNSEKPSDSPFNLTPFAITLNSCPQDHLRPFLCPTDCRLRVDQRAFELGKFDLANELKQQQEEKQRLIRRAREEGRFPPHNPRWFVAETEPDTGERVWSPRRVGDGVLEYWVERERVWKEGGICKAKWKDVDDIFVEEPSEMRVNPLKV